jgi:uncharacterized caspase-like protein
MATLRARTRIANGTASALAGAQLATIWTALLLAAPLFGAAHAQAPSERTSVDSFVVVDCLLPPQRRRVGNLSFPGPRRPIKATAQDCAIRGGEYVEYDRANYQTARAVWFAEAQAGDAVAQNYLGEIYERGLGTEPDYVQARHWYELAAEQGNTAAQFNLGKLYETGLGVAVDAEQALRWYRSAANLPDLNMAPAMQPAAEGATRDETDAGAPSIELIDPVVPETRGVSIATVAPDVAERLIIGRVRALSGLRSVTVNDREVSVETSGIFQARVPVAADGSRISIVAVDTAGRRANRVFMLEPARSDTAPVETFGEYHALVIGNNNYLQMNSLSTARNDARVVGRLLEEKYGFVVTLLEDATRSDIMGALNALRQTLTEDDNLLIYYAGHGTLDKANDRGNWLPVDAAPDDTTQWLSNTSLTDVLNIMAARHVLVVADSCYSGALTRSAATSLRSGQTTEQRAADMIALSAKRSRTTLASGGLAPVLDSGRGGHSVFANAFIDALSSNTQVLDAQRLMLDIRARVAQAAYDRNRFEQVPVYAPINLAGHEFGEFFFVPRRPALANNTSARR